MFSPGYPVQERTSIQDKLFFTVFMHCTPHLHPQTGGSFDTGKTGRIWLVKLSKVGSTVPVTASFFIGSWFPEMK